jgi:hypothetical protein
VTATATDGDVSTHAGDFIMTNEVFSDVNFMTVMQSGDATLWYGDGRHDGYTMQRFCDGGWMHRW